MTFAMIFTYKVVSQVVLQHHIAAALTCISALQYMRLSYMPTNVQEWGLKLVNISTKVMTL